MKKIKEVDGEHFFVDKDGELQFKKRREYMIGLEKRREENGEHILFEDREWKGKDKNRLRHSIKREI